VLFAGVSSRWARVTPMRFLPVSEVMSRSRCSATACRLRKSVAWGNPGKVFGARNYRRPCLRGNAARGADVHGRISTTGGSQATVSAPGLPGSLGTRFVLAPSREVRGTGQKILVRAASCHVDFRVRITVSYGRKDFRSIQGFSGEDTLSLYRERNRGCGLGGFGFVWARVAGAL